MRFSFPSTKRSIEAAMGRIRAERKVARIRLFEHIMALCGNIKNLAFGESFS